MQKASTTPESRRVLLTVLILLLVTTACTNSAGPSGQNAKNGSSDTLDRIRSTKELHVGYFVFEPTIMENPNDGKLSGIFVDMIESIAKSLDAKVVYHKVDLANFAAGLQSRQFDLCIGATFATPQRATAVLFTRPIFYAGYTGLAKPQNAKSFPTWQSMDRSGVRVAVKQGSAIDDFVRDNFHKAQIVRLTGADLTLPLAAVSAGQADVGLMNQLTVFTYHKAHPELTEVLANTPIASTNFSWSVRPEDVRFLFFLNTALEYLENTGEVYRYESQYGIPLFHRLDTFGISKMSSQAYWNPAEAVEHR